MGWRIFEPVWRCCGTENVRDVWDPTRLREPLSVTEEGPET